MTHSSTITIQRKSLYPDRFRSYKINLDGKIVNSVKAKETVSFAIEPGKHSLSVEIDWCRSPLIDFEMKEAEHFHFECGNQISGWRTLLLFFIILFKSKEYLWIRKVENP